MSESKVRFQGAYIVAHDVHTQADFYASVLGLPLKLRDGDRWIQYDDHGTAFSLANAQDAQPASSGTVVVFEVDNFDDIQERVVQAGGRLAGVRDMGSHGTLLSAYDPEGNLVQFFQRA